MEQLLIALAVGAAILAVAFITFFRLGKDNENTVPDEDKEIALILSSGDETLINLYQNAETDEERAAIVDFVRKSNSVNADAAAESQPQETPAKAKRSRWGRRKSEETAAEESDGAYDSESYDGNSENEVESYDGYNENEAESYDGDSENEAESYDGYSENEAGEPQPDLLQEQTPKLSRKERRAQKRLAKRQAKEAAAAEKLAAAAAVAAGADNIGDALDAAADAADFSGEEQPAEEAMDAAEALATSLAEAIASGEEAAAEEFMETAEYPAPSRVDPFASIAEQPAAEAAETTETADAFAPAAETAAATVEQTAPPASGDAAATDGRRQMWLKDTPDAGLETPDKPLVSEIFQPPQAPLQPTAGKDLGLDLPYGIVDDGSKPAAMGKTETEAASGNGGDAGNTDDTEIREEAKHNLTADGEKQEESDGSPIAEKENAVPNRWERFAEELELAASQRQSDAASGDDIMNEILRKVAELEKRLTGEAAGNGDISQKQD
ncbi:MAG: hypothetical protein K6B40_01915 [Firmicutes bacterium]|nr:hypothetical protein [Bacillota bacterium]